MALHFTKRCGCAVVQQLDTAAPLWKFPPSARLAVLHRRRMAGVLLDDEPAGDPDYT